MSEQQIRAPERQFNDLDNEFAGGLGHDMRSKAAAIPTPSPPCSICFIVLKLSREENGNKYFVDGPLDVNQTNQPEHCMRCVPSLQKPLDEGKIS